MRSRQYGPDLTPPWKRQQPAPEVPADRDLVVEEAATGFCGAVVRCEKTAEGFTVTLEDRFGKRRVFPLVPRGFLLEGRTVTLVRPAAAAPASPRAPGRTASGSVAVPGARARVARESRIYVEGRHDAELVERVWGDDLRIEGVVVEYLEGIDDLPAIVADFAPGPGHAARRPGRPPAPRHQGAPDRRPGHRRRRAGRRPPVHRRLAGREALLRRHPRLAGRPLRRGLEGGVCRRLGWPADTPAAWKRILASVDSFKDLEPALLAKVEELIDFVTLED